MFEKARQAYEKAAQLDPKNTFVRQNYEFFKEINDRASRRNAR
jgi:Tfp pilus assembly protein PilF